MRENSNNNKKNNRGKKVSNKNSLILKTKKKCLKLDHMRKNFIIQNRKTYRHKKLAGTKWNPQWLDEGKSTHIDTDTQTAQTHINAISEQQFCQKVFVENIPKKKQNKKCLKIKVKKKRNMH